MGSRTAKLVLVGLLLIGLAVAARHILQERYPPDPYAHAPCAIPVPFALAEIDPRFGFDRLLVTAAMLEAVNLWQAEAGSLLFLESEDPRAMRVSLVFDERQQSALQRGSLRGGLELDQAGLAREEADLKAWSERIELARAARERHAAELAARLESHETAVARWNSGSGSRSEATRRALEAEGAMLRAELAELERTTATLNADVDAYNRRVEHAREHAADVNSRVSRYNATAAETPVESGRYSYDSDQGRRIDVFRAASFDELVWVLAHELGHALGIGHVDDPAAVMHGLLHEGGQLQPGRARPVALSASDRAALRGVCGRERLAAGALPE